VRGNYERRAHRQSQKGASAIDRATAREIRALRRLQRQQDPAGPHVFASERGGPTTAKSFHTLIARLGERAGNEASCPPDGVTNEQLVRMVVSEIEKHPDRLHEDFIVPAAAIMIASWPCPAKPSPG
jgi:hypothetical protein